jgi:radical SAM superfamily enzyme YgiQ (UPF0313 family)
MSTIHLVNIIPGTGEVDIKHPPLGLLYVGTALKQSGYNVKIHQILPYEIELLADHVVKDHPLFVGFSVMTGLPSYYSAIMSKLLKSRDPTIKIVWGGWHPSLTVRQCLEEEYIDIVCIGDGEKIVVEIADAIEKNKKMDSIRSIGFKSGGKIKITERRKLEEDIDVFDLDYDLLDFKKFIIKNGDKLTTSFYSSRGCPFNCAFCCTPSMCGRRWRAHSVDYVADHVIELKDKFGVNDIYFSDDNFFVDRRRAFGIIKRLRSAGISCSTLDVRVDFIDKEILEELIKFDTTGIFFGWESGSDRLLKLMHKNITVDQIISCAKLLSKYPEMSVWGSGIIFLPTETQYEHNLTLRLALKLFEIIPKGTISLFQYMPLPGTEFLKFALKDGFKMPENTVDWVRVDPQGPFYDATWIPWIRDNEKLKYNAEMTQRFMRKVLRKFGDESNKIFKITYNLFNKIAYYRVKNQFFLLPIDLTVHNLFMKGWNVARISKDYILNRLQRLQKGVPPHKFYTLTHRGC